jgi:hypothetical protein
MTKYTLFGFPFGSFRGTALDFFFKLERNIGKFCESRAKVNSNTPSVFSKTFVQVFELGYRSPKLKILVNQNAECNNKLE